MRRAAESFDLRDPLDSSRFEDLLRSLPENILAQSEEWHSQFFGLSSESRKTYVVIADNLILAESFSSAGVHSFGDRVQLADEDARELLRRDRRAPKGSSGPDLLPPSIVSEEDWAAAVAAAEASGNSVNWEVFRMSREAASRRSLEDARAAHEALWGSSLSHPFSEEDARRAHERMWGNNPRHPFPGA
jgi:hypothetical protein